MMAENPFLALFSQPPATTLVSSDQAFNEAAESVFHLTLCADRPKKDGLHYLKDLATALGQESFDNTALDQAGKSFIECRRLLI